MESDVVNISEKLVEIYINMAMEQENSGREEDLLKALENYKKCLDVSQKANQPQRYAEACQKLGDINFKLGNYEESAKFQKTYLEKCEELVSHPFRPADLFLVQARPKPREANERLRWSLQVLHEAREDRIGPGEFN